MPEVIFPEIVFVELAKMISCIQKWEPKVEVLGLLTLHVTFWGSDSSKFAIAVSDLLPWVQLPQL